MNNGSETSWAAEAFATVDLGDKRLNKRLIHLCDRFSDAPKSPINQACEDWSETKAAYRFFQKDSVETVDILAVHQSKTARRAVTVCDRESDMYDFSVFQSIEVRLSSRILPTRSWPETGKVSNDYEHRGLAAVDDDPDRPNQLQSMLLKLAHW